jgi:Zinc finger, C4 type (two domains)
VIASDFRVEKIFLDSFGPDCGAKSGNIITQNSLSVYGGGVLCPSPSTATGFFNPRGHGNDISALELGFPRSMALVPPPPSAWRDPNLGNHMSSGGSGGGGDDITTLGTVVPQPRSDMGGLPQQSITPGSHQDHKQQISSLQDHKQSLQDHKPILHSNGSVNGQQQQNDKNQNIECIVCGDKSSGKHYGQFTCEGEF